MGPLQNLWWLETSKIMESQDSKQKYAARSLWSNSQISNWSSVEYLKCVQFKADTQET